jgi:stage V sporulation protein R
LEPEEDLLLFIRDYNPYLADWEKDLLTIVHESTQYFLPQMETKIMNEGWASYWHYQIMTHLDLPPDLRIEFAVHHNQVLRPHPGGLNPYHLGFVLWDHVYKSHEGDEPADHSRATAGKEAMFAVRDADRDRSFLRRFLDEGLMRKLGMFEYKTKNNDYVVSEVSDEPGWQQIKETLLRQVGVGSLPVIRVIDADFEGTRHLLLEHAHDGRDLDLDNAEKTLGYAFRLWGRGVYLQTSVSGTPSILVYDEDGFSSRKNS